MNTKNLLKRVSFALWAVPLSWIIINADFNIASTLPSSISGSLAPIYPLSMLIFLIIILGVTEYLKMMAKEFPNNRFLMIHLWLIPALFNEYLLETSIIKFSFRYNIFFLILVVAAESVIVGKGDNRWRRASMLFSGTIFFYLAGTFLFQFQQPPFTDIWAPHTSIWLNNIGLIISVAAVFMCDTAAYFTGSLIGKHRLTSISPKKTVEGSIGGLIASVVVMTLGFHFLGAEDTPFFLGPLLGVAIGVSAQVGDLAMSLIKRYFAVKDSSNLIPGHGGILDRFDSLFFSAPVIHIVITLSTVWNTQL